MGRHYRPPRGLPPGQPPIRGAASSHWREPKETWGFTGHTAASGGEQGQGAGSSGCVSVRGRRAQHFLSDPPTRMSAKELLEECVDHTHQHQGPYTSLRPKVTRLTATQSRAADPTPPCTSGKLGSPLKHAQTPGSATWPQQRSHPAKPEVGTYFPDCFSGSCRSLAIRAAHNSKNAPGNGFSGTVIGFLL